MREEIRKFAEEMERIMSENDAKKGDSWKRCDVRFLDDRLKEEFSEWDNTNKAGNKELVDIANFCMMLWNRLEG